MRTKLVIAALAFATIGLGAQGCPPPMPPTPPDSSTGGSPGSDAGPACETQCCTTCAILAVHGCPEGKPTARGIPCEFVCENAEVMLPWPRLSGAPSLASIRGSFACAGGW